MPQCAARRLPDEPPGRSQGECRSAQHGGFLMSREPKLLQGRTAIVTGAGGGIGRGLAQALAGAGANVVIPARRASTGDETLALIRSDGGQPISVQTDGTRRADVNAAVAAALPTHGGPGTAVA